MNRSMAISAIAHQGSLRLKRNGSRDEVIGAWIATPGFLKEETQRLNAQVKALDVELGRTRALWKAELTPEQAKQDQWWSANWVPFIIAWQRFYDEHGGQSGLWNVAANFWGTPTWDGLNAFKARLIALRDSAMAAGFGVVGPLPTAPSLGWLDETVKGIGSFLKTAFYVLLFGGLAVALIIVVRR